MIPGKETEMTDPRPDQQQPDPVEETERDDASEQEAESGAGYGNHAPDEPSAA